MNVLRKWSRRYAVIAAFLSLMAFVTSSSAETTVPNAEVNSGEPLTRRSQKID